MGGTPLVYSPGPGLFPLSLDLLDLTLDLTWTLPGPDLGPGPEYSILKVQGSVMKNQSNKFSYLFICVLRNMLEKLKKMSIELILNTY